MTTYHTQPTFFTELDWKDTNVDALFIKSPRTGHTIQILQGWLPDIPSELRMKTEGAVRLHHAEAAKGRNWAEEMNYLRDNPCKVELTVDELKTLYDIYQKQTASRSRRGF